jgi:uncharacterized protein involved in exopolysaccharide biosynthesis
MAQSSQSASVSSRVPGGMEASAADPAGLIRDHVALFWRRKLLIAFVTFLTMLSAYAALQTQPDIYEVEARLLVKLGRENTQVRDTANPNSVVATGVRKEEINSEIAFLTSDALVEAALDKVGMERFFPARAEPVTLAQKMRAALRGGIEAVAGRLKDIVYALGLSKPVPPRDNLLAGIRRSLFVSRDGESDVIEVVQRMPSAELARDFVDALIGLYLERRIALRRDPRLEDVFVEKVASWSSRLGEIDAEREKLRSEAGISVIADERSLIVRRRDELSGLIAAAERDAAVMGPTAAASSEGVTQAGLAALKVRLAEVQIERMRLEHQSSGAENRIAELDREIAVLRDRIGAGATEIAAAYRREIDAIDSRIDLLNRSEDRLERLGKDQELARQHYADYARRLEDARIDAALNLRQVANIAVLSAPAAPAAPIAPRRLMVMAASLPMGLLLGLALALLFDYFDTRVRSARQLHRLGLPVLASIPIRKRPA